MKDANKIIRITCDCKDSLILETLVEFQGGLKNLSYV